MKDEIRVVGIDDSPFDKFKDRNILVVGTVFRGGKFLDGVMSTTVRVDGINSTKKIVEMLNKSRFKHQLQFILIDGIAVAGFNIIDVVKLYKKTGIAVVVVMRDYPNVEKIHRTLKKIGKSDKIKMLSKAGKIHKIGKIHVQFCGTTLEEVKKLMKITCTHSFIPEAIRVAHLIASGVVSGESKGGA